MTLTYEQHDTKPQQEIIQLLEQVFTRLIAGEAEIASAEE